MKPSKKHLDTINSRLPEHNMKADDLEVLPFMVFDNLLTDRYTIMSNEMMAKLVLDLNGGRAAFNRMHESRENLPVGASVSGRLLENQEGKKELQAMMYAVVKRPDGTVFEEGKDLADRYKTGAVRACSAGVQVGFYKCNICGNDIRSWQDCEHIPGRNYTVDEQPKLCVALMTGHKIIDGVAEDCGIYEVSAVTAGGVAAASAMTEAFGRYEDGADPKEFKQTVLEDKNLEMRLEFSAAPNQEELSSEEEQGMEKSEVKAMLAEHYEPLKLENDKLKGDYSTLQDSHTELTGQFTTTTEEVVSLKEQLETKGSEFTQLQSDLEAANAAKDIAEAYKEGYIGLIVANGVKAGEEVTAEEFATKSIEELKTLNEGYVTKIEAMPSGQQTGDTDDGELVASLDDSAYRV